MDIVGVNACGKKKVTREGEISKFPAVFIVGLGHEVCWVEVYEFILYKLYSNVKIPVKCLYTLFILIYSYII